MAPSDNTKIALGVLTIAGIGITLYLISRQFRKKKKVTASSSEPTYPDNDPPRKAPESWTGGGDAAAEQNSAEPESAPPADPSSVSMSISSWEEIQAPSENPGEATPPSLSESFVEMQSAVEAQSSGFEAQEACGDIIISSHSRKDVVGSFTETGPEASLDVQEATSEEQLENFSDEVHRENNNQPGTDDLQMLKSDATGNDVSSFERVNGGDHASSMPHSGGAEILGALARVSIEPLATQQLMAESMLSFQQVSKEGSSSAGVPSNTDSLQSFEQITDSLQSFEQITDSLRSFEQIADSLQSFEQISHPGDSASLNFGEVSNEIIQPPVSITVSSENGFDSENTSRTDGTEKEADVSETDGISDESTDSKATGTVEKSQAHGKIEENGVNENATSSTLHENGASDGVVGRELKSGTGYSTELIRKALGGSREEFFSNESLQSIKSSGSRQQDFYTPISSPREMDSGDNLSFRSFDDSQDSDELSFYDVEVADGKTPQDRTPTNTPPLTEGGIVDDLSTDLSSSMMGDSMVTVVAPSPASSPVSFAPAASMGIFRLLSDRDKVSEAILQAQSNPGQMEIGQLQVLVELLKQDDQKLLNTALQSIIQATAFTINVNILTVCDCPKELASLLEKFTALLIDEDKSEQSQAQGDGTPNSEALFLSVARVVNNLAMDMKAQPQLESTIPILTDLLMTEGISETVTLASLQPLTNMSTNKAYHGHYTRLLQQLYCFLDTSQSASLRLQCLKLLVNLSLNADMVPHMLAAKAPSCLLDLLDINYDVDLLLRTVTFLANVMTIMQERSLTPSSLPPDEKAPSPETLYAALSALDRRDVLRNKVFRLTRHQSEDVTYQATRLYKCVVSAK